MTGAESSQIILSSSLLSAIFVGAIKALTAWKAAREKRLGGTIAASSAEKIAAIEALPKMMALYEKAIADANEACRQNLKQVNEDNKATIKQLNFTHKEETDKLHRVIRNMRRFLHTLLRQNLTILRYADALDAKIASNDPTWKGHSFPRHEEIPEFGEPDKEGLL